MGLGELLTREGRQRFALERKIKKATNKWMQGAERMKALYALAEDGSEGALTGLVKRFGIQSDKSIDDEQEKEWVFETLVEKGESSLPPIIRALKTAETISWPLRVAEKLLDRDRLWGVIEQVLETMEPGYERDPSRKIQLITYLGDTRDRRVAPVVAPYLEDMDETVRFTSVETLIKQRDEVAREPLLRLLGNDKEESLRIKVRICEGLADIGWDVRGFRGQVEKALPDGYQIDSEGRIRRKRPTA
jgi:HEAT repeat protein